MGYFQLAKDVWTDFLFIDAISYSRSFAQKVCMVRNFIVQLPVYMYKMIGFHMNPLDKYST